VVSQVSCYPSLGSVPDKTGTPDEQVGTFMHELGHNMGLHHGGGDDPNYKPNYPSVMNYMFQFIGTIVDGQVGNFDYSSYSIPLDENALNPAKGITQDPAVLASKLGSAHICSDDGSDQRLIPALNAAVQWNCTDDTAVDQLTSFDVNRDGQLTLLAGYDDWGHIVYFAAKQVTDAPVPSRLRPVEETDSRIAAAQVAGIAPRLQAQVADHSVELSWSRVPLMRVLSYQILRRTGDGPYTLFTSTSKNQWQDAFARPGLKYSYVVRTVLPYVVAFKAPPNRAAGFFLLSAPAPGQRIVSNYGRASSAGDVTM
jgi:hypothetical protein